MADIKINNVSVQTLIDQEALELTAVKTSDLENDVPYITVNDKVAEANMADTTVSLATPSGVQEGSVGPEADINVGQNNQTVTVQIPYFTVNEQGIITSAGSRNLQVTTGCNNCSVTSGCSYCNNHSEYSKHSRCSETP